MVGADGEVYAVAQGQLAIGGFSAAGKAIIGQGDEAPLSMAPSKLQEFIGLARETFDKFSMMDETPALLTSPPIRPFVRSIVERFRPATLIMFQNEVHPRVKIKTLGQI